MRVSNFIIILFLCFVGSKSEELTETIKNILKDNEFKEDIKRIVLHLLRNNENLKRDVIDLVKEDLKDDIKGKFFYLWDHP